MEHDDITSSSRTSSSSSSSSSSSMEDYSRTSSSSSSNLVDDASSNSNGPLYELSELMAQLPIKRGLSKYFEGKTRSFTCLSSVGSVQEFAKKESAYTYKKKMKLKLYTLPRATISKKLISRNSNSMSALRFAGKTSCRPPLFPVQNKNFSSV